MTVNAKLSHNNCIMHVHALKNTFLISAIYLHTIITKFGSLTY